MSTKPSNNPVRIIGSRELHQNLPSILKAVEQNDSRYVLTVHGKPKAVLIGAEPFLNLVQGTVSSEERMIGLHLSLLLGASLDEKAITTLENDLRAKGDSSQVSDAI